jgi:hypothetical protein
MTYQFIFKQFGNWKVYVLVIILWLTLREQIIDLITPYVVEFDKRIMVALGIIILLSLILIYFYEKNFELENFNTTYPRDMNIVTPMCNTVCKRISNLENKDSCEKTCNKCNAQI